MRRINGIGQKRIQSKEPSRCFYFKHILIFVIALFFFLNLNSQEKDGWTLKKDYNGVKVYTQTDEFHDYTNGLHYEYIILRVENITARNKKLEIAQVLYYDEKKISKSDIEYNTLIYNFGRN